MLHDQSHLALSASFEWLLYVLFGLWRKLLLLAIMKTLPMDTGGMCSVRDQLTYLPVYLFVNIRKA